MAKDATSRLKKISAPSCGKILDAAVQLFAERGFKGTTTAQIAARAKVNEALIFRHFPQKTDLYQAIIENKIANSRSLRILELAASSETDERKILQLLALEMEKSATEDPTFLRLYYFSALEGHPLSRKFYDRYVRELVQLVAKRIRRGMKDGRLRQSNPRNTARMFVGMIRDYLVIRELFEKKKSRCRKDIVEMVDLFFEGISAQGPDPV